MVFFFFGGPYLLGFGVLNMPKSGAQRLGGKFQIPLLVHSCRTPAVQRHLHRVYIAVIGGIVAYALGAAWSTGSYAEQLEVMF